MVSVVMFMCRLVVIRPYSSLAEVVFSHYLCLSRSYYPSKSSNNHLSASYVLFKQVIYIHLCLHHSYYSASHPVIIYVCIIRIIPQVIYIHLYLCHLSHFGKMVG